MGRRNKRLPVIENIAITDVAAEGKAIAKTEDGVVFITGAVPGDVVNVQLTKKRSAFSEGHVVSVVKYSDIRTEPKCEHFGVCGGCKWQMLPYEKQIAYKQQHVIDALQRIGKLEFAKSEPILPAPSDYFYRNKLEFTFSAARWLTKDEIDDGEEIKDYAALGFHIPRKFVKIVDVKKCWLQPEPSNAIRLAVREYAKANELSFYNIRKEEGLLRNMIVRTSETGEVMVNVIFFYEDAEKREGLMNMLAEKFPEITSLLYVVNGKKNDTITDQEVVLFKGRDHIFEEMDGLRFKIGPKSFYQTNSKQAFNLYKKTLEYADIQADELVYDLYTGTGTIANFVARTAKKVIGIEYVPEAIEDAKINAELNGLDNTEFYAGDIKDLLTGSFIDEKGRPDVVILDPPRAGLHKNVIEALLYAAPKKMVYVSCNPGTQARDLALLADAYEMVSFAPVDMFPHTYHIENVVLMHRK